MTEEANKPSVDFVALWENTPLALVHEAWVSGEVLPLNEDVPVGETEEVVGELTVLEKAIFTAMIKVQDSNNRMVKEARKKRAKVDTNLAVSNKNTVEFLNQLLWACIKQRFAPEAWNWRGMGIRNEYKLVKFLSNSGPSVEVHFISDPAAALAAALMGDLGGLDLSEHDCKDCPTYEECDLPIKKPRAK